MSEEKRKPERTPQNKAIDPAPENKAAGRPKPPGYWQKEQGGILAAVVLRYLADVRLNSAEVDIMREYCRQWVGSGVWDQNPHGNESLAGLRAGVDSITSNETLSAWLQRAENAGMDPL
jgi:hypothetical protein